MIYKQSIDAEFQTVLNAISAKIKEAADALLEAERLASAYGIDNINEARYIRVGIIEKNDMDEYVKGVDVLPLFRALDDCGWSSSSLTC